LFSYATVNNFGKQLKFQLVLSSYKYNIVFESTKSFIHKIINMSVATCILPQNRMDQPVRSLLKRLSFLPLVN